MSEFLSQMEKLSSAEEFLDYLKVPYDAQVVRVNRLHILKRFHDYIGQSGLPGDLDDAALGPAYADMLQRAYLDFTVSDGKTEKLFKVFKQAEAAEKAKFVGLDSISRRAP